LVNLFIVLLKLLNNKNINNVIPKGTNGRNIERFMEFPKIIIFSDYQHIL